MTRPMNMWICLHDNKAYKKGESKQIRRRSLKEKAKHKQQKTNVIVLTIEHVDIWTDDVSF